MSLTSSSPSFGIFISNTGMPVVKFTRNLKRYYPAISPFETQSTTLPQLINDVDRRFPGIKDYILDEQGQLRKHVQIFIGNRMISDRQGLTDPLNDEDEVFIMQALSGG